MRERKGVFIGVEQAAGKVVFRCRNFCRWNVVCLKVLLCDSWLCFLHVHTPLHSVAIFGIYTQYTSFI